MNKQLVESLEIESAIYFIYLTMTHLSLEGGEGDLCLKGGSESQ